jgi:hypothetical protein
MTIHTSRSSGPAAPLVHLPGRDRQPAPPERSPVPVVALDREAARAAISAAAGRFTALLRVTDDIERPAAGTDWTVAETAAHVSCMLTGLSAAIAGEPLALPAGQYVQADFPTRLAASNAATIAMVDHTDAGRLAELITVGAQRFLELVAAAGGAPVTYEVRLRGNGPRYVIRVADGTAEVRSTGGPVDCVISADPVTFLLVAYGRMPLGRALLRGGMLARGRRPWLSLRFKDLFFNP